MPGGSSSHFQFVKTVQEVQAVRFDPFYKKIDFPLKISNQHFLFSELSQPEIVLRKLITVNDLTLCLDKRNASGKIEVYQEPMLYRCSMRMHLLRQYHSATIHRNSLTRFDIYCNKMEFSMTEQQVPMLMRLLKLLYALQQKQLKPKNGTDVENLVACTDSKGR